MIDFRGESWAPNNLVRAVDVSGLVLSGSDFDANFTLFERTNDTPLQYREGMVRFENSSDCSLQDCALLDAGHSAIWLQGYAQNHIIKGNRIERPGFCGLFFQGIYPGDTWAISNGFGRAKNGTVVHPGPIRSAAEADVNKGHIVSDNLIYDYGRRVGHGSGMWWFQAGTMVASHNHIQEGPRDAFGVYGVRFGSLGSPNYGAQSVCLCNSTSLRTVSLQIQQYCQR